MISVKQQHEAQGTDARATDVCSFQSWNGQRCLLCVQQLHCSLALCYFHVNCRTQSELQQKAHTVQKLKVIILH